VQFSLSDFGRVFSTRDRGAEVRQATLDRLNGEPVSTLCIDLDGVLSLSYSFVDEYIGELATGGGQSPSFANASALTARTIARSLENRGLEVPTEFATQAPGRAGRGRAGQRRAAARTEPA
jgi:hypothetical protein